MRLHFLKSNENKGIFIRVDLPDPIGNLWFYREGASVAETELLKDHISRMFSNHIEEIRKISYGTGWRDAKKKRPKRNWFATCLEVLDWEKKDAGL